MALITREGPKTRIARWWAPEFRPSAWGHPNSNSNFPERPLSAAKLGAIRATVKLGSTASTRCHDVNHPQLASGKVFSMDPPEPIPALGWLSEGSKIQPDRTKGWHGE